MRWTLILGIFLFPSDIVSQTLTGWEQPMGLFSRFLKVKDDRLWAQFEKKQNDRATLVEKARAIAPVIVQSSSNHAELLQKRVLQDHDIGRLFFESQILDLHLMDKLAFASLGAEKRKWFMDALYDEVISLMSNFGEKESEIQEMREAFAKMYGQRFQEYASTTLFPEKNDQGGLDIRKTVGWKFGEVVGGDDIAQLALVEITSDHFLLLIEHLQLRELLNGYR